MKVYVLERDNPTCWEEPELFINPDKAVEQVREEYESIKEDIGIACKEDEDYIAWCEFEFDKETGVGTALIDRDSDGDRWQWRITEHEI